MQTVTDYMNAYFREKARADELRKMLDRQIKSTSEALREVEKLRVELKESRELYEANHG